MAKAAEIEGEFPTPTYYLGGSLGRNWKLQLGISDEQRHFFKRRSNSSRRDRKMRDGILDKR